MAEALLYSFRRCPYAIRARMALLISETPFVLHEVRLSAKPAALIAASPKATVPVLVTPDGGVIDQSLAIMRWALGRHDPEGWLDGDDAALIETNDGAFKHHLDRAKYPERYQRGDDADPAAHRRAALALLAPLEQRLARQAWLCGPRRRLTDAALMPFVRQFAAIDRPWFEAQPLPGVRRWLADQLGAPLFARAMLRAAPDDAARAL